MPIPAHLAPIPLSRATRLLNHGPTALVTSAHAGRTNVMAAAWTLPLDFDPPKILAVIAASTLTRQLVESSGEFALNLPGRALAAATLAVGSESGRDHPDKFARHGLATFAATRVACPLIAGCAAWLECRVLRHEANERDHDLFIAEVLAAAADTRVFADGRWHFESGPDDLRTLHHVAGGRFYTIGEPLDAT
jgi:flavin reductase (DIM6/NTAB) family NADH-FMN oxidoreductase RutF